MVGRHETAANQGGASIHKGFWVDLLNYDGRELSAIPDAACHALIRIKLAKDQREIASFEWIEDGSPRRTQSRCAAGQKPKRPIQTRKSLFRSVGCDISSPKGGCVYRKPYPC
jgi:hypothetical protein